MEYILKEHNDIKNVTIDYTTILVRCTLETLIRISDSGFYMLFAREQHVVR